MDNIILKAGFLAFALLLGSRLAVADETKGPSTATESTNPAKAKLPNKAKTKAKSMAKPAPKTKIKPAKPVDYSKLVELNSATKEQLMTLPGVNAAAADRIIAGRPYLTKTNIETRNILPKGSYSALRALIYVVPPAARK